MIEAITLVIDCDTTAAYCFYNCLATVNKTYNPVQSDVWNGTAVATGFHAGDGTQGNPYVIFSPAEFAYFVNEVNNGRSFEGEYIILSSNINLNGKVISPVGDADHQFKGRFNGHGHVINNAKVTSSNNGYCGVFGYVDGSIEKVGFTNITITYTASTGEEAYIGPIAYLSENGTVTNVYSTGSITSSGGKILHTGGLIGYAVGSIDKCYSGCKVVSSGATQFVYSGGLIGYLNGGSVSNSFAYGNVTANGATEVYSRNGGLLGENIDGTVTNCYRSSKQTLTRYGASSASYNADGESINFSTLTKAQIIEQLTWSDEIWSFVKEWPTLISE